MTAWKNAFITALGGICVLATVLLLIWGTRDAGPLKNASVGTLLDDIGAREIGAIASGLWTGAPREETVLHPRLLGRSDGLFIEARKNGVLRGRRFVPATKTLLDGLTTGISELHASLGSSAKADADVLLLCPTHSYRRVKAGRLRRRRVHQGILGIEFEVPGQIARYSPLEMLSRNGSFESLKNDFLAKFPNAKLKEEMVVRHFDCEQIWIPLDHPEQSKLLFRGNVLVKPDAVTETELRRRTKAMGDWLKRGVHDNGRMTYKWWPSRGMEASSNNMIRQWMATLALVRFGKAFDDGEALELADKNIRYNLQEFYRVEGGRGFIEFNGKVKLGAIALASLALFEFSQGDPNRALFSEEQKELFDTTVSMQRADGSFQTMLKPEHLDDPYQNFYTGEALLLWARIYESNRDPELLKKFMSSFRYYRAWHRSQRNPAFIPWHTQADFIVWKITGDSELRDFIFEINDWLLGFQEWDRAFYPDTRGRFYDDRRRGFGPPHASATGVYLEGLADAVALAREVNDEERQIAYQKAITRALRQVFQLQFTDGPGIFYVSKRSKVVGGLRTTLYENTIRVDNVQHNLLAAIKVILSESL